MPRCFDAAWDEETKAWHLVLEDLSESHAMPTEWPLPPTMAQCKAILATLARFNAAWWDDPRLGISIGSWIDPATYAERLQGFAAHFAAFAERVGDRMSRDRYDLYRRVLDAAPRLFARYHSHRNVTLIHGDAHVWNFLLPKDAQSGDVRLFDWDTWRIGVVTADLANMMAMHWSPELRRRRERPLLDHYHAALLAQGVGGYDRRGARRRLPPVGASADPHARLAGSHRHPALDLVEPHRTSPAGRRRSRLPRAPGLIAAQHHPSEGGPGRVRLSVLVSPTRVKPS